MDHARCLCRYEWPRRILNPRCPRHGLNGKDPVNKYRLSANDRKFLLTLGIDPQGD